MSETSIYLHIPFCVHRCAYCDFNTYAGLESLIPAYMDALCQELRYTATTSGGHLPVHTVFFGGGTPSLLAPDTVERILQTISDGFDLSPAAEITLEANPGTLTLAHLKNLRAAGVNRISLGMQSAHPEELQMLERQHDYLDVIQAVKWIRQARFNNLNLDLIFGLPEQSDRSWRRSLEWAHGLHPEHFSLYALTLEHGTPMAHWASRGLMAEPDPDRAADMYEWACERLENWGYLQYEISNWGQRGSDGGPKACQHNLQYWRGLPYLGFGAGAHGYAGGIRTANVLSPSVYIRRMKAVTSDNGNVPPDTKLKLDFPRAPATASVQEIDRQTEIGETMMMGLRLVREGISRKRFYLRFQQDIYEVFPTQIDRLLELNLLEWSKDADALHLTARGRLLGNQVFIQFI